MSLSGSPSVSGATVTLTLAAALAPTDTDVKVSYAKPGSGTDNKLADAAGNEVAEFHRPGGCPPTNAAPTAADSKVTATESTDHAFTADHFGYMDANGDTLASVKIESLPGTGLGQLVLDGSTITSASATSPQVVTKAQLDDGDLLYRPVAGQFGDDLASFAFKVNDGTEDSASAYAMTVDVDAASTHEVLVSNLEGIGTTGYLVGNASGKSATQGFRTGDHAAGYDLHSAGIDIAANRFSGAETLTLSIYSSNNDGTANALVHTLTTPWSVGAEIPNLGTVYFTAAAATLDADTDYHLVIHGSGNAANDVAVELTSADVQSGKPGWMIEDALRDGGTLNPGGNSFRMVVRGSLRPDTAAPGVTSIERQSPSSSPTNADSLTWRVTFDENVQDVDAADFAVSGTTATLAVSEVTASTVYDVTASGGNLAGLNATATLSFAAGQDIADTAGNALTATTPTGTNEPDYVVDNTAPTVTSIERQSPSSSPTNADSLTWRVTFGENVRNVGAADFAVSGTTATLAVSEVTASTVYDVTASGGDLATLDATATLSFAAGQDIADTAGNTLAATTPTGTDEPDYAVDNTAPTLTTASVNGTSLVLTFGEDLAAASSLANTAFTVKRTPQGRQRGDGEPLGFALGQRRRGDADAGRRAGPDRHRCEGELREARLGDGQQARGRGRQRGRETSPTRRCPPRTPRRRRRTRR